MLRDKLDRESLADLYERLVNSGNDPLETGTVFEVIEERSTLAGALYALKAADLSQAELDDFVIRLNAVQEGNPDLDPVPDTVQREIARVQLDELLREQSRREARFLAAERSEMYLSNRTELIGSLMGLGAQLKEDRKGAHFFTTFDAILSILERAQQDATAGAATVVQVLREVSKLPSESIAHELDPWMRWGIALELMSDERGLGGETADVDLDTRTEATRAKRMFFAEERQDARYDEADLPLDLTGDDIADLLDAHHHASHEWVCRHLPQADMDLYLAHTRREEVGRPEPHVQIIPESAARKLAERGGAFLNPLIFTIPPKERSRTSSRVWSHGLLSGSENVPWVTLHDAGGDPRVRWGAPPHPYGILCSVSLPTSHVLYVFSEEHPKDAEIFEDLTAKATLMSRSTNDSHETLRSVFQSAGYYAIAHYHPSDGSFRELIVLDPSPATVQVIREAIPSFMGDRPLNSPAPSSSPRATPLRR